MAHNRRPLSLKDYKTAPLLWELCNGAVGQKYERITDRKFYRGLYFNGPN